MCYRTVWDLCIESVQQVDHVPESISANTAVLTPYQFESSCNSSSLQEGVLHFLKAGVAIAALWRAHYDQTLAGCRAAKGAGRLWVPRAACSTLWTKGMAFDLLHCSTIISWHFVHSVSSSAGLWCCAHCWAIVEAVEVLTYVVQATSSTPYCHTILICIVRDHLGVPAEHLPTRCRQP